MRLPTILGSIVLSLGLAFWFGTAEAVIAFSRGSTISLNDVTSDGIQAIAVADVNRDGKADIIVVQPGIDMVAVYINDGMGAFPPNPITFGTNTTPVAVTTGDFNNDGKIDIAIVDTDADKVTTYLGDGTGNFTNPRDWDVDPSPIGIVAADFNNDLNADLAVLSDSSVHLLKSNGGSDGMFTDMGSFPTGRGQSGAFAIAAGRISSHNFNDLAVSNASTVTAYLNNGDGTFGSPFFAATSLTNPQGLVIGEFDGDTNTGDNNPDIAVINLTEPATVLILQGNGAGQFTTFDTSSLASAECGARALVSIDLDGDGKKDLAVASDNTSCGGGTGNVQLYCQQTSVACSETGQHSIPPAGGFQIQQAAAGVLLGDVTTVQSGDVDGDGHLDLVAVPAANLNTIRVLLNMGGSVVPTDTPSSGGTPTGTPAASPTFTSILPTPTPTLTPTPVPTATPTPIPTAPYGECNTNDSGQPSIGGQPVAVAIGDFDHNGQQDIAVADKTGNRIAVLLSHISSGAPGACGVLGLQPGDGATDIRAPVALATADLDGDGQLDLAVVGADGLWVLTGDGAGGFFPSADSPMTAGTTPQAVAIADFNRDGKPDIIVANKDSNDVSIFFNTGDGSFSTPPCTVAVGRSATFVSALDLNLDGHPDFAVASQQTNDVVIFLQNVSSLTPTPSTAPTCSSPTGPVSFTSLSPVQVTAGQLPKGITFGNFDPTKSVPDYAVATSSTTDKNGDVQVFLRSAPSSEGSGRDPLPVPPTAPATPPSLPSLPSAIGSGDINRDSHPDLIVTDANNNTVVVYLANSDGSFTKSLIPFAIRGRNPVAVAVKDIDGDGVLDIVTANQGDGSDGSVSILVSSRPPPTPTPLPTDTPTQTGTPTLTGTPTPSPTPTPTGTPTPTTTGTRLPTSTPFPSPIPTDTMKPGTIGLQGSCAIAPLADRPDWSWVMLSAIWIGAGLVLRRRGTRRAVR